MAQDLYFMTSGYNWDESAPMRPPDTHMLNFPMSGRGQLLHRTARQAGRNCKCPGKWGSGRQSYACRLWSGNWLLSNCILSAMSNRIAQFRNSTVAIVLVFLCRVSCTNMLYLFIAPKTLFLVYSLHVVTKAPTTLETLPARFRAQKRLVILHVICLSLLLEDHWATGKSDSLVNKNWSRQLL